MNVRKFSEHGTSLNRINKNPVDACSQDNIDSVQDVLANNPTDVTRRRNGLGLGQSTFNRIVTRGGINSNLLTLNYILCLVLKEDNHQNVPSLNLRNRISFKNLNEQKNPHQKILSFDTIFRPSQKRIEIFPRYMIKYISR